MAAPALAQLPPTPSPAAQTAGPAPVLPVPGLGMAPAAQTRVPPLRLGTLGFPVFSEPEETGAPQPGWTLTPSIGLGLLATDNVFLTARDREADLVTLITPDVLLQADTPRLQGALRYAPRIEFYASNTDENRIDHFLNGQAIAALVPDLLFLDVRGTADVRSLTGGLPALDPISARRDRVQTFGLRISPYALLRIPGAGVLQLGYAIQLVEQEAGGNGLGADGGRVPTFGLVNPFFAPGDFTAHEAFAVFRTGEELDRLELTGTLSATNYVGDGVLDGATRRIALLEAAYAINETIAVLGDLGYEEQHYGGPEPYDIDSPIWAVGVRLTGPESVLTVKYGQRDGFDSWLVDGSVAIGGRTRLNVGYREQVTTEAQRIADTLASTNLDRAGNPVDPVTGVPLLPQFATTLLSAQGTLLRVRTASAAVSQTWPRDTVTLALTYEEREPVVLGARSGVFDESATAGTLSWLRALGPATTGSAFVQIGSTDTVGRGNGDFFVAGLGLFHELGEGLTVSAQYRFTQRNDLVARGDGSFGDDRATQNLVLVELRKTFF